MPTAYILGYIIQNVVVFLSVLFLSCARFPSLFWVFVVEWCVQENALLTCPGH